MSKTKRHYDQTAFEADRLAVFNKSLKGLGVFFITVFIFMFFMIVLLGVMGHTKHKPSFEKFEADTEPFGKRIDLEYKGKKLPIYGESAEHESAH